MEQPKSVGIGRFEAELFDVELPLGLKVQSVHITGESVQISHPPFKLVAPNPAKVRIVVLEAAITEMLANNTSLGLKKIQVRLADGRVHVDAAITILVELSLTAVCTLRVVDESKIYIDIESVKAHGVGIKQLVTSRLETLNPVLDAKMLPIPAKLHRLEIGDRKLTAWGEVSPPE